MNSTKPRRVANYLGKMGGPTASLANLTSEELARITGYTKKLNDSDGVISALTQEEVKNLSLILTKYLLREFTPLN